MSSCRTFDDMIPWARKREIDMEAVRKRKLVQVQVLEGTGKKPKVVDSHLRGQYGRAIVASVARRMMDFAWWVGTTAISVARSFTLAGITPPSRYPI